MEKVCKPDSVPRDTLVRASMIISLGFGLPRTSSDLPEGYGRAGHSAPPACRRAVAFLFGLAPSDAYRAVCVATHAVGSYPAVSPLPEPRRPDGGPIALAIGGLFSVVQVSDCSAWALPSAPPLESGLSSRSVAGRAIIRPSPSRNQQYRKRRGPAQAFPCVTRPLHRGGQCLPSTWRPTARYPADCAQSSPTGLDPGTTNG